MPTVYAILGDANTRKSSTTRALTGVAQRKSVTVATVSGDIEVFVQVSSLQELNVLPSDFISQVMAEGHKNVLVELWISSRTHMRTVYPPGLDYFLAFLNAGWAIRHVVVLGVSSLSRSLPPGAPSPNFIPQSASIPVNRIASHIRAWWAWL
jgi:hypothetical protein